MLLRYALVIIFFLIGYIVSPTILPQSDLPTAEPLVEHQDRIIISFPIKVGMQVRINDPESHLFNKVGTVTSIGVESDCHLIEINGIGYIVPYRSLEAVSTPTPY